SPIGIDGTSPSLTKRPRLRECGPLLHAVPPWIRPSAAWSMLAMCWILADTHIRQGRSRNLRDAPVDRAVRGQHEAPPRPIWCVCRVPGNGEAIDQGFVSLEVGDDRAGRSSRGYRSRPRALARGVGRQAGGIDVV